MTKLSLKREGEWFQRVLRTDQDSFMELASPQKDQPTLLLLTGAPKCALFSGQGVCEQHGSLSFKNFPWIAFPSLQGMGATE